MRWGVGWTQQELVARLVLVRGLVLSAGAVAMAHWPCEFSELSELNQATLVAPECVG